MFLSGENRYAADQSNFSKIPGSPIGYWMQQSIVDTFDASSAASKYADFRHGMSTSDNNRFLRFWFEVSMSNIGFQVKCREETANHKWYIYLKGGSFRKWYGNYDYVVNWKNDGEEIKEISNIKYPYLKGNLDFVLGGQMYFFSPGYTWSSLTSGMLGIRKFGTGCIFDAKGQCYFTVAEKQGDYLLAFYNSKVFAPYGEVLAPTLDFNSGVISKVPIKEDREHEANIVSIANNSVLLSKEDWDSYEYSWNFKRSPLV